MAIGEEVRGRSRARGDRAGRSTRAAAMLVALAAATGHVGAPWPRAAAAEASRAPELLPATAARVLEEARRPGASAVLVNVWATWCDPCREEFPDLMKLRQNWAGRGLRLVLVSGDFDADRAEVLRFLTTHGVDFPTFIKAGGDMDFIDGLHRRWSGAIPASFLYDSAGRLHKFWEGKADYATLERRVEEVVSGRAPARSPGKEKP